MIPLVTKTLLLNHLTQSQAGMLFLLSFTLICKTFATPARRDIMQSSEQQAFDTLPVVGYEPEHQVICWTRTKIAKVTQIFQGQVQSHLAPLVLSLPVLSPRLLPVRPSCLETL
jgi:hypothetical protein